MIINGSFEAIDKKNTFDIRNTNGSLIMQIDRNIHIPNKLLIKDTSTGTTCIGTITRTHGSEEFLLHQGDKEILHIKQFTGLNLPKFDITSTFGDFSTKPILRSRELLLLNGDNTAAMLRGNPPNYEIEIDDNSDIFYTMCIVFGITTLLPMKILYKILSRL